MVGELFDNGEEVEGTAVKREGELDFGLVGVADDGGGAAGKWGGGGHCFVGEMVWVEGEISKGAPGFFLRKSLVV